MNDTDTLEHKNLVVEQSCKDCVFREYLDDESKQSGCALGRLEKLARNGATIVEEGGYKKIMGRYCSAKRGEDWVKGKEVDKLELAVRSEILIRTEVYVYLDDLINPHTN